MKLSEWQIYPSSIYRIDSNGKKVIQIWFSNLDIEEITSDYNCFEVFIKTDYLKKQPDKTFFYFEDFFSAILFSDKWVIDNGFKISNPLYIPDIG